jgi:hypothetical protein
MDKPTSRSAVVKVTTGNILLQIFGALTRFGNIIDRSLQTRLFKIVLNESSP